MWGLGACVGPWRNVLAVVLSKLRLAQNIVDVAREQPLGCGDNRKLHVLLKHLKQPVDGAAVVAILQVVTFCHDALDVHRAVDALGNNLSRHLVGRR